MPEETALRLRDVTFRYLEKGRRNILDHVDLDIAAGTLTVMMGAGGCGKSTLAAVAAGLYPENGGYLDSGRVEWFGHALADMDPQQRAGWVGMLFQNPDLQFCMDTLRGEMRFCMENLRMDPAGMDDRIGQAADELGLCDLLDQPLHTLSGGEKQKAALACLYVMECRCLLLDECLANLDREAAAGLVGLLRQLHQKGRTIIAIDHQADLWLDAADEIILLEEGGRTAVRGIDRHNLANHRADFTRLGLFYPGRLAHRAPATPSDGAILSLHGVCVRKGDGKPKRFGRKKNLAPLLLDHADAVFPKGCMAAVLGPSGSGKTTTFLAVLKQHTYEGRMELDGQDLARLRPRELYRQVGIVFQNPANQFITQNVSEEVCASLRVWDPTLSPEDCRAKAESLLADYGLERYRRYSPYMLSQGQQRRLAVLSVLCGGQKLLLLDEPTYGQDARSVDAIMRQLRTKVETEGLSVIFITHDRALAAAWANRVFALRGGKLEPLSPEEVCP